MMPTHLILVRLLLWGLLGCMPDHREQWDQKTPIVGYYEISFFFLVVNPTVDYSQNGDGVGMHEGHVFMILEPTVINESQ